MPLHLRPPRPGRSPNYEVRGSYLGVRVERTAGTPDKAIARRVIKTIERDIERGRLSGRDEPTFGDAALAYHNAVGQKRFLAPLNDLLGDVPLADIDQALIDETAAKLYPRATPATRNRQVHTPISAILKHAGIDRPVRRPKGGSGKARLRWLWPEDAERLLREALAVDRELGVFLVLLIYTGLRLSEGLGITARDLRLAESFLYVPDTKTGEPRAVYLPPIVVEALCSHPRGLARQERLFRFTKGQRLYQLLAGAADAAGVPWFRFHDARHTYATWMRRFGGLDLRGLAGTGAWADEKSASRYAHVVASEEAQRAVHLPVPSALFGENAGSRVPRETDVA